MSRIVFLVEEHSLKVLLNQLIPRLFPDLNFICLEHEGKQALEKSIPRKLRAWREPGVQFVVLRDNDGGDCRQLKTRLSTLCREAGRPDTLVRIACQELEAWYLGEPDAMAEAFERDSLRQISNKSKYRDPDIVPRPSEELTRLVPEFQKVSGARKMGSHLSMERNVSQSFRALVHGVRRLQKNQGHSQPQ